MSNQGCNRPSQADGEDLHAFSDRTNRLSDSRWIAFSLTMVWLASVCCGCRPADSPDDVRNGPRPSVSPASSQSALPADEPAGVPAEARGDDWFEDVTERTGIEFAYRNGRESAHYTLLESVGGGAALIDYDGDGDLDLFCTGGGSITGTTSITVTGRAGKLFRNDGAWKFTDVTDAAGLGQAGDYSHGCAVADYDRDGRPDLFVTCFGQCQLFRNTGDGQFREVAVAAGIATHGWCTAAAWGDVDHDGWPDLYVAAYLDWKPDPREFCGDKARNERDVCMPSTYPAAQDRLFRNRRDGTFEEITQRAGLNNLGRGMGIVALDLNQDGWLDFYVANDAGANQLYLGSESGRFAEVANESGCAASEFGAPEGSMGVDAADYDGDGLPDVFVTNFELEDNSLYRNNGGGHFSHVTFSAGLAGRCRPYVKFGTVFADFDMDGWQDLVVVNGHVLYRRPPLRQPAFLYRNQAGKRFEDVSERGGPYFSVPHIGRGVAAGDLDNNGTIDLVIVHQNDPISILSNRRPVPAWFRVELKGTRSDPGAVGAVVSAEFEQRSLTQFVRGGGSYLSHGDQRIIFPLRQEQAVSNPGADNPPPAVTVRWPSGLTERFSGLRSLQTNLLVEGSGEQP